jgi:hypothetical protein
LKHLKAKLVGFVLVGSFLNLCLYVFQKSKMVTTAEKSSAGGGGGV